MTGTAGVLAWTTPSSSAAPSGAAGGDLSGTYPNPTITALDATKIATGVVDNTEFNYLNGVTSSIQTQLTGKQATDATLTSLAAYNTNGILVQTAADTFVGRSIVGTANRLTVTNGDGVAGNPTINIPTALLPSPVAGDVGKFLKATAADTSVWTALGSSDITTALGFTPINKAGDSLTTGTFTYSGAALLRTLDPVAGTDVANKQYVDSFGQWTKNGSDVYRASGNVGVGIATPGDKLDIYGALRSSRNTLQYLYLFGGDATNQHTYLRGMSSENNKKTLFLQSFNDAGGTPAGTNGFTFQVGTVATPVTVMQISESGTIGIGTTSPQSKLDVNGAIRIGVDATACSAANAGAMRFNTPNVEFCNGTSWAAFGVSGAAVASAQITDGTIVDTDVNAAANITATKLGTGVVDNTEFNYLNGVTSSIQTQLNGKQATDTTLTALAGYNTNGIMVQTAADTFVGRSIVGTANRVTVTNGDGVSGNPTINIPTALLPSPVAGDVGKFLKATAADTSVWTSLASSDVTTALGFTPINKAGDSLTTGTITLSGAAVLRSLDPVGLTDVANKQYVDSYGQWTKNGSDVYRSSGNVGIGTATPSSNLEVVNTSISTGRGVYSTQINTGPHGALFVGKKADGTPGVPLAVSSADFLVALISQGYNGSAFSANHLNVAGIATEGWTPTANGMATVIYSNANGTASGLERMRIDQSGNIGIGTTTPAVKTEISSAGTTVVSGLRVNTAGTPTTGSGAAIELGSSVNSAASYSVAQIASYLINGGSGVEAGHMLFSTIRAGVMTEAMRILNSGNVGIGTTAPAAKLDVAGAAIIGTGVGAKTIGVVSFLTATNSTTTYIHIKTPYRPAFDSKMYLFKVEGYAYGDSKDIELTFAGYSYTVTPAAIQNPVSRDPQGLFAPTQYIGSDGYIYLRFKPANTYYTSFRVDSTYVGNGRIVTAGEMSVTESTSATL
jgi:hypothetical protein